MMKVSEKLFQRLSEPGVVPYLFLLYLLPRVATLYLTVEPFSDAAWYFNRGAGLAAGDGYSEGGIPTAFWPPGWPLTLGVLFKLFGVSLLTVQVFNLISSLIIGWLTYDLGRKIFESELAGRISLVLLGIYPNSVGYVPLVWTEVFYTMVLIGGCWLLVGRSSISASIFGGVVFGVATLVKVQSILIIPFIYAIAVLREQVSLAGCTGAVMKCGFVVLLAFTTVLPWSYRNYRVFGQVVLVSTNGGLTMLTGNNPSARGDYSPDDPLVTSIRRTVGNQVEVDKEATRRSIEWIWNNPVQFLKLLPLKVFHLWGRDGESEWWFQAGFKSYGDHVLLFRSVRLVNQIYYVFLLISFVWAGLLLFKRQKHISTRPVDWWFLPYALALCTTLVALIFSGQSRYHYPLMPFVIMSSGWLLVTLWSNYNYTSHASKPDKHPSMALNSSIER